ncbi:MAG: response regulator [Gammaproteobacteria bacterium]|nr:response regulator [Gammaproteobacteria bacterium]
MNILVIEDDQAIREMICLSLQQADYQTFSCQDVKEAKQMIAQYQPDCLVVDWMLPDSTGVELLRWLRRQQKYKHIPALMLTARAQEQDKITGLDSGADDYMTKPLSLRELQSRIKALLRRPASYIESTHELKSGPITINSDSHRVTIHDTDVELSKTEFLLLKFFVSNENKVFSRNQILDHVWGINAYLDDRTVDVHILRLRKILKQFQLDQLVKTVRGSGYRFSSKSE